GSGEKMSKSKGTGLDRVALNQQYGTDAMRFCLASMAAPGTDIILSDDKLASARNFANKIWNAARFLFVNLDKFEQGGEKLEELASPEVRAKAPYRNKGLLPLIDEWIFGRLMATAGVVNSALTNYRFHEAAQHVYQFFWGDFCDWYIEWVKPELQSADRERATVAWKNLFSAFEAALRLLHPIMPFLTEELWHNLPQAKGDKSIALKEFPKEQPAHSGDFLASNRVNEFATAQEIITHIRNMRAEMKLDPKKRVVAEIYSTFKDLREGAEHTRDGIMRLGILSELRILS